MTPSKSPLTEKDLLFYKKQGYLLPEARLFGEDQFSRLKSIFEEILAAKDKNIRADMLDTPHFKDERLMAFLMDEKVLDLVESILGPNFGLWSSHFICKEAMVGRATPWHEDSSYWKGRFDNFDGIVTIWLAIDESTKENGCMRVIPESHLATDVSEYEMIDSDLNTFNTQIKGVNEAKQVYFELQPNQYSLHDSRIIHGAQANTSQKRRCGYTIRYFSQSMKYIPEANRGHKIWHCRGENPHNNPVEN
jgi:ectoine hydroxylase-related dioxygenase (phytanoyl-CoA dioxygenase family)